MNKKKKISLSLHIFFKAALQSHLLVFCSLFFCLFVETVIGCSSFIISQDNKNLSLQSTFLMLKMKPCNFCLFRTSMTKLIYQSDSSTTVQDICDLC